MGRLVRLFLNSLYLMAKFRNLVKTFGIFLQVKIYTIAVLLLIVETLRLYLDITKNLIHKKPPLPHGARLQSQELAYSAHVPTR